MAKNGRHGSNDIPLTERGGKGKQAGFFGPKLFREADFAHISVARLNESWNCETSQGLPSIGQQRKAFQGNGLTVTYEGLHNNQIAKQVLVGRSGIICVKNGETLDQVKQRVDRVVARIQSSEGNVAIFSWHICWCGSSGWRVPGS